MTKNQLKYLDYLLEELMYIKHDAFNCKCQEKKKKVLDYIKNMALKEK